MLYSILISAILAAAALLCTSSCNQMIAKRTPAGLAGTSSVETGAHWASPRDFPALKRLGYQFAVVSFDEDRAHWAAGFDAAERAGLRLIAGLYPYPYRLDSFSGTWTISRTGQEFLAYAKSRAHIVKAVYVFNEPYWLDPVTGSRNSCGAVPAVHLRSLRVLIRAYWPGAKIYHDLGQPSQWAPGGVVARESSCVGDRYADATGIADFAGIWIYPVGLAEGYNREAMLPGLRGEINYVERHMRAEPVVLGQTFGCSQCAGGTRMPTADELHDINCTVRWMEPQAVSWYPWRQPAYETSLASHPELWNSTAPGACPD